MCDAEQKLTFLMLHFQKKRSCCLIVSANGVFRWDSWFSTISIGTPGLINAILMNSTPKSMDIALIIVAIQIYMSIFNIDI